MVQWTPCVEDGMPVTSGLKDRGSPPAAVTLRTLRSLQSGEHCLGGYGLVLKHRVTDNNSCDEDGVEIEAGGCEVLGVQVTFGWLMRAAAAKAVESYRASTPPTLADRAYKKDVIEPLRKYVRTHDLKARQAPTPSARQALTPSAPPRKRRATSPPPGAHGGSKASSA